MFSFCPGISELRGIPQKSQETNLVAMNLQESIPSSFYMSYYLSNQKSSGTFCLSSCQPKINKLKHYKRLHVLPWSSTAFAEQLWLKAREKKLQLKILSASANAVSDPTTLPSWSNFWSMCFEGRRKGAGKRSRHFPHSHSLLQGNAVRHTPHYSLLFYKAYIEGQV